jgi:alkanesulfonate monooxygenase SsuD/methylene tetrahydromethanopterin reductase-like flavin-dependent oxidoreductase (luciferase family)
MADNVWIVGSPDEVAEKLQALSDEVGGFGVLLAMGHEWLPKDKWTHSTEMLINEVIPKLA